MSNTQYAFLKRSSVPDRAALQASVSALGFDLTLHPDFHAVRRLWLSALCALWRGRTWV